MLKTLCSISHWQVTEGYSFWNWWRGVVSRDSPWSTYLNANHCTRGWGEHGHMTCSLPEGMWFLDPLFLIAQSKVCTSIHKYCQWCDPAPCPESCGNEFRICWVLRSAVKHCFLISLSAKVGKGPRFQWALRRVTAFQALWCHDIFQSFSTTLRFY